MQRETANRLPKELKDKWWALLGHFSEHNEDGSAKYDLADDIINTNSFEEFFGEPRQEHFAVLPETAVRFPFLSLSH